MPSFQLPDTMSSRFRQALLQAFLANRDSVPWHSQSKLQDNLLTVRSLIEDEGSGHLAALYPVIGHGHLMVNSGTLLERPKAYSLTIELIRGKIKSIQALIQKWQEFDGVVLSTSRIDQLGQLTRQLGQVIHADPGPANDLQADQLLAKTHQFADTLIETYCNDIRSINPGSEKWIGFVLNGPVPDPQLAFQLRDSFNSITIPMCWGVIEADEGHLDWRETDAQVAWALTQGYHLEAGPLIDFSAGSLPTWLNQWDLNLASMAALTSNFVESAIRRYGSQIRHWQVAANSNASVLSGLNEEMLFRLTGRLVETVNKVNSSLKVSVGISQPFGDYMARETRDISPYYFVDHLVRFGVHLAGIDLELILGVPGRGSLFRDPLETLRLLDAFSQIGLPLKITLGIPSSPAKTFETKGGMLEVGSPEEGYTEQTQANWARLNGGMALAMPLVKSIQWLRLYDVPNTLFSSCGILTPEGNIKPVFESIRELLQQNDIR